MTGGAQSGHGAVSQTPCRSGWPSGILGAGALRSILPSGNFGVFGAFWNAGHCANTVVDAAATISVIKARFTRAFSLNNAHVVKEIATLKGSLYLFAF